jgi:hypothetical protein
MDLRGIPMHWSTTCDSLIVPTQRCVIGLGAAQGMRERVHDGRGTKV